MALIGKKGQAAITDSLYFLMIVSALSIILFIISVNYGNTVTEQIKRQYNAEYATSAFKTIFYSSTPRIPGDSLENTPEVDSLLAVIKEDYADDSLLNRTEGLLANNVVGIMEPVHDNFDYVFSIYTAGGSSSVSGASTTWSPGDQVDKLVFLMFSVHNKGNPGFPSDEQLIFLCSPESSIAAQQAFTRLESILSKVGSVSKSESWIRLISLGPGASGSGTMTAAKVSLAMWVSTNIPKEDLDFLNCRQEWKRNSLTGNWERVPGVP